MSRHVKKGLDYFPMDTGFMRDLKIQRLLLEYGSEGLSVYILMLSEVYSTGGYYLTVSPFLYLNLSFTLKLREEEVKAIVDFCIMLELFDKKLFDSEHILTSFGIQSRYEEISKRTKNVINPAYRIERINVAEKPISVAEIPINVTEKPISATKASRVLNENENENENENKTSGKIVYGKNKSNPPASDDARREELLRMAAIATGNCRNA